MLHCFARCCSSSPDLVVSDGACIELSYASAPTHRGHQLRFGYFPTRPASAWLTIWLSCVAAVKSAVSLFLVTANAIPVAVSPHAKLPPAPPTPNTVGESFAVDPRPPTA